MARALMQNAELIIETGEDGGKLYRVTGDCQGETVTLPVEAPLVEALGSVVTNGMKCVATVGLKKNIANARILSLEQVGVDCGQIRKGPFPPRESSKPSPPRIVGNTPGDRGRWEKIFGGPFHNPYTFIPFSGTKSERHSPTPQTADEWAGEARFTGTIDLEVEVHTPLKSVAPEPEERIGPEGGHPVYGALRVGNDVIVPATGIRGALRNLLTIVTGGPLGQVDENAVLHQGRTVNLGPPNVRKVFLAEVREPRSGRLPTHVRLGKTLLVGADDCERLLRRQGLQLVRPDAGRPRGTCDYWVEVSDVDGQVAPVRGIESVPPGARPSSSGPSWRLKLSGRPIPAPGKKEGAFLPGDTIIELEKSLWTTFESVHKHSDMQGVLKSGDLVWLEPVGDQCQEISCSEDVKSIQWSRWGREGPRLANMLPEDVLPDHFGNDGLVADNTDLFGRVDSNRTVPSLAGRIRPENLVFCLDKEGNGLLKRQVLAPLSQPRPGCLAFYRMGDAGSVSNDLSGMRGYKVYRTQTIGAAAPWLYDTQQVFDGLSPKEPPQQKFNQTCDLVAAGSKGSLRLAFRSLSRWELWMLLEACQLPWRLGGGKPLGLGLCRPTIRQVQNEKGETIDQIQFLESVTKEEALKPRVASWKYRAKMWRASQEPIPLLRYPRLAKDRQRGGHVWFSNLATPQKNSSGLQKVRLNGSKGYHELPGQVLPPFDPERPEQDVLFGYDMEVVGSPIREIKPAHQSKNVVVGSDSPAPQDRESRKEAKRDGRR